MKNWQKWLIALMIIIPISVFFIIISSSNITIKEFSWWAIIGIFAFMLVFPFFFLLVEWRVQRKMNENDTPLQKQKKRFLIGWGYYIILLIILFTIAYCIGSDFSWHYLCIQVLFLLSMFFVNIRLFFPKKNKPIENDCQNNLEKTKS